MSKSSVSFVAGIHVTFGDRATLKGLEQWYVVGTVEQQPFYLHYLGLGATNWGSKGMPFTPTLRKRILAQFKKEVRHQDHSWLQEFSTDLFSPSSSPEQRKITAAVVEFYKTAWRDKLLDDRDEDYVVLAVPYTERAEALAAGAVWWPHKKVWAIHQKLDHGAVSKWMI